MNKNISDAEAEVKAAAEKYKQTMTQARDPQAAGPAGLYRFRVPKKYWDEVLAPLSGVQLKVFLRYRVHANWQTGEALLGLRYVAKKEGLALNTAKKARQDLIELGYLAKSRKASRCHYYRILKI